MAKNERPFSLAVALLTKSQLLCCSRMSPEFPVKGRRPFRLPRIADASAADSIISTSTISYPLMKYM